jgi:MbtH protein
MALVNQQYDFARPACLAAFGHRDVTIKETEMSNPFDDDTAQFFVLVNDEGQHSLWPVFADVPDGWTVVYGQEGRQNCLAYMEESWTDMRPKSLVNEMAADHMPTPTPAE